MLIIFGTVTTIGLITFLILNLPRFGKHPSGARLQRIVASPNYRDGAFQNLKETPMMTSDESFLTIFRKMIFGKKEQVKPLAAIPSVKNDLHRLNPEEDYFVWLGHSSYFFQTDHRRFLVDPVLSGYASPFPGIMQAFRGSDIYKAEDIPEIDFLFITHDHWDHLDHNTIRQIHPRVKQIFCGLGVGEHLEHWGVPAAKIHEFDWHDHLDLPGGFQIEATPARHFSGRGLRRNQTLWLSFVVKTPTGKFFIGGDGGYDTHFAEIGKQHGPFDLAILENGQYDQRWRLIHMLPEELPKAMADLRAERLIPVHNSKFALAAHPWDEPMRKMAQLNGKARFQLLIPMIGEVLQFNDPQPSGRLWWKETMQLDQ